MAATARFWNEGGFAVNAMNRDRIPRHGNGPDKAGINRFKRRSMSAGGFSTSRNLHRIASDAHRALQFGGLTHPRGVGMVGHATVAFPTS
jgi:hypothetical protein